MDMSFNTTNKQLVRKHFERHAREYDLYADIQHQMAERLMDFLLQEAPECQCLHILEIGCGTGILTERILRQFPNAQLTVVDLSAAMIAQTKDKLGAAAISATTTATTSATTSAVAISNSIRYLVADAEDIGSLPREKYDLIISNATFQWFTHPEQTIRAYVAELMSADSVLAFATFGPRTFYELHEAFRIAEEQLNLPHSVHGLSYGNETFWQEIFADVNSYDSDMKAVVNAAFNMTSEKSLLWKQEEMKKYFPSVREFLYSIKRIGAGNTSTQSQTREGNGGSGRQLIMAMEKAYEGHFTNESGIQATYDLVYGLYQTKYKRSN